ncbi:MAG: hypothetical protein V4706_02720 [Pseudomonadota bacterium]
MPAATHAPTPAQLALQEEAAFAGDLFSKPEPTQATPALSQTFKIVGRLTRNAELRSKPSRDNLHVVPVVCLEVKNNDPTGPQICYAEKEFTDATRSQAEHFAKKFLKGHVVTVLAPVTDMRVSVSHPDSIRSHDHP